MNAYFGPRTKDGQTVLVRRDGQLILTAWQVRGRLVDVPRKGLDERIRAEARICAERLLDRPAIAA